MPPIHPLRWMIVAALAAILLLLSTSLPFFALHEANNRSNHIDCLRGQRTWDALSITVHTAYESRTLQVNPRTLPPATTALLAALEPLLKQSATIGRVTEAHILARLGPRPEC